MLSRRWLLAAGLSPGATLLPGPAGASSVESSVSGLANRDQLAQAKPLSSVVVVILAGFYAPGDGGGAQYRRVDYEPHHPGKLQSADGVWWELTEPRPVPEMFGADRTYARDTPALQACCDYVRANFVYNGHGRADQGAMHLSSRVYHIDQPIDFGSRGDGSEVGWGIVGEGLLLSTILLKLDASYPGIDASGVAGFFMRGVRIARDTADQSSCGLLLARVRGGKFHNDTSVLEDVSVLHGGPNSVAAIVCQAGDTSSFNRIQLDNPTGAALCIGASLPVVLSGPYQSGTATASMQLGPQASAANDAYVGHSVRVFGRPPEQRDVRVITAYDGLTKVATLDSPWPEPVDPKSRFEIYAVRSRFRTVSNYPDATQYRVSNCNLSGQVACRFMGGSELTMVNSYLAAIGQGSEAIFLVEGYPAYVASCFRFFNTRWENQTSNPGRNDISAFLTRGQVNVLEIHGEVTSCIRNGEGDAGKIAAREGGSIHYFAIYGEASDPTTPLFDIRDAHGAPGHIECVEGFVPFKNLGVIGSVGVWRLESSDSYGDDQLETLAQICRSGSYKGVQFVSRQARLSGSVGTVAQVLALQPFDPALSATHGGRGPQLRARFAIPAKALDGVTPNVHRRLKIEVRGHCAKDTRLLVAIGPSRSGGGRRPDRQRALLSQPDRHAPGRRLGLERGTMERL